MNNQTPTLSGTEKLKAVIEEIDAIMQKHDIAGIVVLHTPGHAEFKTYLQPSYSCVKFEFEIGKGQMLRFRAKREDYPNNEEKRIQVLTDTSNMMKMLSDVTSRQAYNLMNASDMLDKHLGSSHTKIISL